MSRAGRALLVAALTLATLAPAVHAGVPEPRAWSPYDAVSTVNAVAIAAQGGVAAAALGPAVTTPPPPGGVPPVPGPGAANVAQSDLIIFQSDAGRVANGSSTSPSPLGRSHVAVSASGDAVASLGNQSRISTGASGILTLYYSRIGAGNWSGATPVNDTEELAGRAVGLALSADGRRVAVLFQDGDSYTLRGYAFSGTGLDRAFEYVGRANATALAASSDLGRLVVSGRFPGPEGTTRGGLRMYAFAPAQTVEEHLHAAVNGTLTAAAVSANGARVAAGTGGGDVLLFNVVGGRLGEPSTYAVGAGNVSRLAMSASGERVSAVANATLVHLDVSAGFRQLWNATLAGNVTSLALNRTGGVLLVATSGTGGGVYAYGDSSATPVWSINGAAAGVAVDAEGREVVYAQRTLVGMARLPRALVFELPGGANAAPAQTVAPGGVATFNLSVRNPGAAPETVRFQAPSEVDARFTFQPETLVVDPGASAPVTLTVALGPRFGQARTFNVSAFAASSGLQDNVTLGVAVQARANVTLIVNDTELLAAPGQTTSLLLGILNNGTRDAAVGLSVNQSVSVGPPWNLSVEQTSFIILPGTRTSVRVDVTPPADAANGTSSTLTFTLRGADGEDVQRVTLRINPRLDVSVDATGRVVFVEPGRTARYNVTVTNSGSLGREFEVLYEVAAGGERPWAIDIPIEPFPLGPGESRTVPVRVVAPADSTPDADRLSLVVFARSVPAHANETPVSANLTLFANVEAPRPTTTTPGGSSIPAPGAILSTVAAAAAALGLSLRRRGLP